jgi:hypothetical protein
LEALSTSWISSRAELVAADADPHGAGQPDDPVLGPRETVETVVNGAGVHGPITSDRYDKQR